MHTRPSFASTLGALLVACGSLTMVASCSDQAGESQPIALRALKQPIINGTPAGDNRAGVVFLLGEGAQATGTLIAPNIVLTARHTVSRWGKGNNEFFDCSPGQNDVVPVYESLDAKTFGIYTGRAKPLGQPAAKGKEVRTPGNLNLCVSDVALVILETPITDIRPLPVRLLPNSPPKVGDEVTSAGWGVYDARGLFTNQLRERSGNVLFLGPGIYQPPGNYPAQNVPANMILVNTGFCVGDSGGPLFSNTTGAVIATGFYISPLDPATVLTQNFGTYCDVAVAGMSLLSSEREWILRAFAEQGYAPWLEGREPPRDFGGACVDNFDCNTNFCLNVGATAMCSKHCDQGACPDGYECIGDVGNRVCAPPLVAAPPGDTTRNGCAAQPLTRSTSPWGAEMIAAAGVALIAARRRRYRV